MSIEAGLIGQLYPIQSSVSEQVTEPAGQVSEPAGQVSEPVGQVTEPVGQVSEPLGQVSQPAGPVISHTDDFELYRFLQKKINDPLANGSKHIDITLGTEDTWFTAWEKSEFVKHKDITEDGDGDERIIVKKGCFAYGKDFTEPYEMSKKTYRTIIFHSQNLNRIIRNKLHGYKKPGEMKIGDKLSLHHSISNHDDTKIKVTIEHIFKLNGKVDSTALSGSSYYILFLLIDDEDSSDEQDTPEGKKQKPNQLILCVRGDESIREPDKSKFDKIGRSILSVIQPNKGGRKSHKKRVSKKKLSNKRTKKRRRIRV